MQQDGEAGQTGGPSSVLASSRSCQTLDPSVLAAIELAADLTPGREHRNGRPRRSRRPPENGTLAQPLRADASDQAPRRTDPVRAPGWPRVSTADSLKHLASPLSKTAAKTPQLLTEPDHREGRLG